MSAKITTLAELKKELTKLNKAYAKLVKFYEKRGLENFDHEDTEYYGACLGKQELCDDLLKMIEK